MEILKIKINDINTAKYNPRIDLKPADPAYQMIKKSIETFGFVDPLVWNKRTGVLVGGHQRFKILKELGYTEIDCSVVDVDDGMEKAMNISLNKNSGEWDDDLLSELLKEVAELPDFDMEAVGFSEEAFDELLESIQPATEITEDEPPEPPEEPVTHRGDVWVLGRHKLMCGDSTDEVDVAKLMDGAKAHLLITSPPYWVGMEYETQKSELEIDEFIKNIVHSWTDFMMVDYGRIVINTGTAAIHRIDKKRKVEVLPLIDKWQAHLKQRGWLARHYRIWAKGGDLPASISPKTDVVDQHWEHICTFEHQDSEYSYIGTFWSPAGEQRGQEKISTKWAQQGVWNDVRGDRAAGGKHCAAFPVEIPARNIRLYTKQNEICIDPFCGAGTSIVGAEQLNRICYGMELGPKYCDVIIQRYVNFTGNNQIMRNGEPYEWVGNTE